MYPPSTNRPLMPGAILGYTKNGTPIRLIAGGSGEGEGGDAGNSNDQGGATGGSGSGDGSGDGQNNGDQSGTASGSGAGIAASLADADKTSRTIEAIRGDFKAERTRRQALEKELADIKAGQAQQAEETKARNLALAKAFGFAPDDPPDPEKLAAELAAERQAKQEAIDRSTARERELTVELHLMRQAAKHGANPELLADSRTFMAKVAGLDPGADSFGDDLGDAIKAAVEANPAYKLAAATAGQQSGGNGAQGDGNGATGNGQQQGGNGSKTTAPPARSGGEHNGAAGGNRQWTMDDVNRLPRTRAGGEALQEAIDAGLCVDLGYAPTRSKR